MATKDDFKPGEIVRVKVPHAGQWMEVIKDDGFNGYESYVHCLWLVDGKPETSSFPPDILEKKSSFEKMSDDIFEAVKRLKQDAENADPKIRDENLKKVNKLGKDLKEIFDSVNP